MGKSSTAEEAEQYRRRQLRRRIRVCLQRIGNIGQPITIRLRESVVGLKFSLRLLRTSNKPLTEASQSICGGERRLREMKEVVAEGAMTETVAGERIGGYVVSSKVSSASRKFQRHCKRTLLRASASACA